MYFTIQFNVVINNMRFQTVTITMQHSDGSKSNLGAIRVSVIYINSFTTYFLPNPKIR